ncbi:MAG: Gfo/Idh/MocA family protein [Anaerolineae bacterium]
MAPALRFGIIGWNDEAEAVYRAISALEGAGLTVVGAEDPARLQGVSEYLGARLTSGMEQVWQSEDVDAVYIALPAGGREEQVLGALAADKPVLMAPPLALDVATASRLFDSASQRGVALGLTDVWAVDPALDAVRMQLLARLFGAPLFWQSVRMVAGPGVGWQTVVAEDLALSYFLTGLKAIDVRAQRAGGEGGASIVLLTVTYQDGAAGFFAVGSGVAGANE